MVKIVDNYTLTQYIGKGQYGKVYRAVHVDTRIEVAIKVISLAKFQQISKLCELTRNQIETLRLLEDNINVVKFVEIIKTNSYIYLVYEFCQEGTLEDFLRKRGVMPEKEALLLFRQLTHAMKSLHQHHVLHRDIKPNNIFFKADHLKLADFGFCKRLRSSDDFTQTSLGSPLYMAPQILNGEVYGSKADVWSCGIVLYQMLFGHCPYGDCNIKELLAIHAGDKPLEMPVQRPVSPIVEMMLRRMLQKDQFKRISWEDFFYEYDITSMGNLTKKEKDFEYDLMKLMKRNSSIKKKPETVYKFDWARILEKDSTVHSEELGEGKGVIDDMVLLKRKIKQFENEHTKMLELTLVLENMLECPKQFQYSNTIVYFLVHTLALLAANTRHNLEEFAIAEKATLDENPVQQAKISRLLVVFNNEAESVKTRANSIKVALMQGEVISKEVFKFPHKPVLRKFLKQYVEEYEKGSPGSTALTHDGNPVEVVYLLKVVWGCLLALPEEESWSEAQRTSWRQVREIPFIKSDTHKLEVAAKLNRLLVALGL